jgi:hypothetical protein
MAGVFLSYAREDLPFVGRLHAALGAAVRDRLGTRIASKITS